MKTTQTVRLGPEVVLEGQAYQLAQQSFEDLRERAAELVAWGKVRRENLNRAEVASLRARYSACLDRRTELKEVLRLAPGGDLTRTGRKWWYYGGIAVVLIAAGVFFAHLTLAPFGLGWEAWAFSGGLGLVGAFWTDMTLEKVSSQKLIRVICILALASSLAGLIVMAALRGDILALYLRNVLAADSTGAEQSAAGATGFYTQAIPLLRLLMGLLAVAMELGSGVAIFELRKGEPLPQKQAAAARKELDELENEMVGIIERVTRLENDPAVKEAAFWRDFYLGFLERIKRNVGLLPCLFIALAISSLLGVPAARAQAGNPNGRTPGRSLQLVMALDLTQSVAGRGYDQETDYTKNVAAARQLLLLLPPGTKITVLAITDQSFSRPYILLSARIPRDKGPLLFEDRVAIARNRLGNELAGKLRSVKPGFRETDVFGALVLAGDIFKDSGDGRRVLVLFSDMRQATRDLNLESPREVGVAEALRRARRQGLVADLQGIEIYVLGADDAGKSVAYWTSLRDFWKAYFRQAGASLKSYSPLRDPPTLGGLNYSLLRPSPRRVSAFFFRNKSCSFPAEFRKILRQIFSCRVVLVSGCLAKGSPGEDLD